MVPPNGGAGAASALQRVVESIRIIETSSSLQGGDSSCEQGTSRFQVERRWPCLKVLSGRCADQGLLAK
jgi:hypothetical protein